MSAMDTIRMPVSPSREAAIKEPAPTESPAGSFAVPSSFTGLGTAGVFAWRDAKNAASNGPARWGS